MSVQHKDLVSCCVEALDTFDPIRMATDEHINEYTKNKVLRPPKSCLFPVTLP